MVEMSKIGRCGRRLAQKLRPAVRLVSEPFRGSAPGATLLEYIIVTGFVALFAIAAFNKFGKTLYEGTKAEAARIEGHGLPNAGNRLEELFNVGGLFGAPPGGPPASGSGPDVTACTAGPPDIISQDQIPASDAQDIQNAADDRRTAQSTPGGLQDQRDASEAAGRAAARGYAATEYPGPEWSCVENEGQGTFDVVCTTADGRVAILEAQGGDSTLGSRTGTDGSTSYQQGTTGYVESIVAAMAGTDPTLAQKIDKALETGQLAYQNVQQKFDSAGNPTDIQVHDFLVGPGGC